MFSTTTFKNEYIYIYIHTMEYCLVITRNEVLIYDYDLDET